MAKDDMFKIIYVILTELYEAKKAGEKIDTEAISSERLGIPSGYLADIIIELIDNGYVKGVSYRVTKSGRVFSPIEDMSVTLAGVEYLQENSMMKKVHEALKNVKDIVPGI